MNAHLKLLDRLPGGESGIHKRTVRDQVADKLTYMIHSGLLQAGDDLPSERELAETLKVARETVRSAIGILADRKMLEVSQGARTRVIGTAGTTLVGSVRALSGIRMNPPSVVNEARQSIEVQVIRLAAARISEADLAHMKSLVQAQKEMLDDPVAFQISDREFHSTMYAACGNSLLTHFVSDLYDYALDFRRQALQLPGTIGNSVKDHERIVQALCARHAQDAEQAVTDHLQHIHQTTEAVMNKTHKD